MKKALLSLLIVLAMASLASAHDLLPPKWRGDPGTSRIVFNNWWDRPDYFSSYDGSLTLPEIHHQCTDAWHWWTGGMLGMPGYGWYLPWSSKHCRLIFDMDDYNQEKLQKDIRVQVTFYAPYFYNYYDPWYMRVWASSNDPWDPDNPEDWDGYFDIAYADVTGVGGYYGWKCAAFDLQLRPNPDSETIGLDFGTYWPWWYHPAGPWTYPFGGYVYIDQVVIDTRCIPEPSALCLLIFVSAMLLFVRRRCKA